MTDTEARPEHDASDDAKPVPVDAFTKDPKPTIADRARGEKRRPILPAWMKSQSEFLNAFTWACGHYWHTARFHVWRSPLYAGRMLRYAPRGAWTCTAGTWGWLRDREGAPLRAHSALQEDAEEYLRLRRYRDGRVALRWTLTLAAAFVGTGGALALYLAGPGWLQAVAAALGVAALGVAGTPVDKPLISVAVVKPQATKLTEPVVTRALGALNIARINAAIAKKNGELTYPNPIAIDGPGWLAELELPYGVTATDVIERRDRLASGLRRQLGCVWPEAVPEQHEGWLRLWVGNETMSKAKQAPWPLLEDGQVDLFKPFPFGTDPRGRLVSMTLMFASMIIGAIPRMGKTFAMRLICLAASLDPRTELHLFDLKGTGDFKELQIVCHSYRAGEDLADIEYGLAALRDLQKELRRRAKVINSLPSDICPENKVTPQLADMKQHGLHPILVAADECQKWFEHKKHGEEIEEICEDIVKRGPALGMIGMFGTQRPDADSLPTGISANAVLRFCLKVMGWQENDMVLGTGSYKSGVQATMFGRKDLGIGYLAGEGDDPKIVRSFYVDNNDAKKVAQRARAVREAAGMLAGHALDPEFAPKSTAPAYDLLKDILAVVPAGEDKVWNERIAQRLEAFAPAIYGGWKTENVTTALKPLGVGTKDVAGTTEGGTRTTRRGIDRADVADAVAGRNGSKP